MYSKKIAVVHSSLNPCGGAEFLALKLCKALREEHFHTGLVVLERTHWDKVRRIFGEDKVVNEEFIVPPFRQFPTIYSSLIHHVLRDIIFMPSIKNKFFYDLVIVTYPLAPLCFSADIIYMHFPYFAPGLLEKYHPKYAKGLGGLYVIPYKTLYSELIKAFKRLEKKPILLTNSNFSKKIIEKVLCFSPMVVYPPVDIAKYLPLSRNRRRKNYIVVISRIEEAKNLNVIPEIAKRVKEGKFLILGSLNSKSYMRRLYLSIKSFGVNDRVLLLPNASEQVKIKLLNEAKAYLHTMKHEHFGIAVVEAMSAGLVPIVHRSGGPWIDILDRKQGMYGFAFNDNEEASTLLQDMLSNEGLRREVSLRAIRRAVLFNSRRFCSEIMAIVKRVLE
ncbi:MAG: glycosyltransferase [Candidatus Bathyarchaeia archaeon]